MGVDMSANQDIEIIANTVLAVALRIDDFTADRLDRSQLADGRLFIAAWDVALATEQIQRYTAEGEHHTAEFAREQLTRGNRELKNAAWNYLWTYKMLPHQQAA
jgi:hypothetical protein